MKTVTRIEANQRTTGSEKKLRVAAYCRVSTGSDDQLESLAEQKKHYETYIQAHENWKFAGLYYDEGISGTKKEKRSELMRLLSDCEAAQIDFIITKSISRFARNTTDCLEMVRRLLAIQKTFTDESFRRCVNYGQLDKYLVNDHHEGIISKADFEAAAVLIDRHAVEKNVTKGSHKYQLRYSFSGKIVCGECGATLKHRTHRLGSETYEAWCCSTHIYNKESCSMKFIRDDDIKLAFVTMMNKLVFGHKLILKPYLLTLHSSSTDSSIQRIQQLRLLIEQNTGQQETLTRLMANGFIDRALFGRELNAIMAQTDEYRAEIDTLSSSVTGDGAKLKETERLIKLVERGRMFTEFDADLFSKLVDRICAFSRNEIGFVLKCGLTLRERIGE